MDLIEACRTGNVERVKELLQQGVDPTSDNNLALHVACRNGQLNVVATLLQDERVDPTDSNNSPIGAACILNYTDVVALLLKDGRANPVRGGDDNHLRWACYFGYLEVIKAVLQDGRVEPTELMISLAKTDEIREMLVSYKYRVDGKEYCRLKEQI